MHIIGNSSSGIPSREVYHRKFNVTIFSSKPVFHLGISLHSTYIFLLDDFKLSLMFSAVRQRMWNLELAGSESLNWISFCGREGTGAHRKLYLWNMLRRHGLFLMNGRETFWSFAVWESVCVCDCHVCVQRSVTVYTSWTVHVCVCMCKKARVCVCVSETDERLELTAWVKKCPCALDVRCVRVRVCDTCPPCCVCVRER